MNRVLNWFRRRKLETDLDRELSYHLDRRVSDLIHSGIPEPEARRRAALELGGATQVREEVRDIWLTRWLRDFVYDVRFSARSFLRSPSFTATAVLSLALGIGATTAIYSLVDQIILHALPVDHPERLVLIDWNGFQMSLATGFLAGSAPALQAGRKSLDSSLRERGGTPSGGLALRRAIVTAQIAFTLILVIAAGLFVRTLSGLLVKGPGFDTSSLISFGIKPALNGYSGAEESRLIRRITEGLRDSSSIQASAVAHDQLLLGGAWSNSLTIQAGERYITDREVQMNAVSPGFFATLGARIVAGRDFNEHDALNVIAPNQSMPVSQTGQRAVIVNEAFVKRYFGGRNPLGARVAMGSAPDAKPDSEIVGVVENISYRNVREQWEQAYFPTGTEMSGSNFYVRFRGTPESAFRSIRAILRNADPTLPISYFRTLDEQIDRSLNTERMLAELSSSFGTLALLLSLVGLYGVMSFVVTQRTREIGIRLALGATRLSAIWLVLRDALVMIAGGTAIALPCVWALGRLVESQLYDVKPTDPVTILAATLVLCSTALGAALIPARRASAVNPTEALRFE